MNSNLESIKRPLVSVITSVLNAGSELENTIISLSQQTYSNFEYIIIDGKSTDETIEIINKYENSITYWISEKDSGIYDAWNKGILKSSGEWICFIGAGDTLERRALEQYVNEINMYPESLEYISSIVEIVDKENKTIYSIGSKWEWKKMMKFMNVAHVGSFHSRKIFQKYGLFDISYKIAGDYALFLKIGKSLNAAFFPIVTAKMLGGGISTNSKVFAEVLNAKFKYKTYSNPLKTYLLHIFVVIKFELKKIIESLIGTKFIINR